MYVCICRLWCRASYYTLASERERARAHSCGRSVCNIYTRCACNLYSARLQFYLLHVFVANRAHTVYVKPRCWHVHATFPFQNRFWRRAPRRPAQSTTSTLLSCLSTRAVRLLTGATLVSLSLSLSLSHEFWPTLYTHSCDSKSFVH